MSRICFVYRLRNQVDHFSSYEKSNHSSHHYGMLVVNRYKS